MKPTPFRNAALAILYIVGVILLIDFLTGRALPQKSLFVPTAMLSLFVLSVACMAYLFFGQPFKLHVESRRKEALSFYARTVYFFAAFITLLIGAIIVVSS